MNQPLVSIIMSNYNGERFIEQTINSVLRQTYSEFEFIIIDDCSTDNSRKIINQYTDNRIRKIFFDQNEQMCFAFNYGLKIGKGEYYARIDSDDTWLPDKLEKQIRYLENNKDCGACFTLVNVVDEHGEKLTENETDRVKLFNTQNRTRMEWINHFFFKGSCLCHPSAVFRKEIIEKVGFYNYSLRQIQDYDLWVRIAKVADIYVLQERLVNYRWCIDGSNASAPSVGVNNRSNYEFGYVISRFFDDMRDEDFCKAFQKEFINKEACTKEELECEKLFLLLNPTFCGNYHRDRVLDRLVEMLQNDNTRKLLREKYKFTQKDFYELTTQSIYYENKIEVEEIRTNKKNFDMYIFWIHEHIPRQLWNIGAGIYHYFRRK